MGNDEEDPSVDHPDVSVEKREQMDIINNPEELKETI